VVPAIYNRYFHPVFTQADPPLFAVQLTSFFTYYLRQRCHQNRGRRHRYSELTRQFKGPRMFRPAEVGIRVPVPPFRFTSHLGRTVFKLPVELFFEIFSYFDDHRRFIRNTCGNGGFGMSMITQFVERSTVIRKLTMTCWALRNILHPVLWKNTEGCIAHLPSPSRRTGKTYGLYAQCVYLLSNPMIASYVQWV